MIGIPTHLLIHLRIIGVISHTDYGSRRLIIASDVISIMNGIFEMNDVAEEQCILCGLTKSYATKELCYEDIAKDYLVKRQGLENPKHIWVEK